jgi:hypothetical protein
MVQEYFWLYVWAAWCVGGVAGAVGASMLYKLTIEDALEEIRFYRQALDERRYQLKKLNDEVLRDKLIVR